MVLKLSYDNRNLLQLCKLQLHLKQKSAQMAGKDPMMLPFCDNLNSKLKEFKTTSSIRGEGLENQPKS